MSTARPFWRRSDPTRDAIVEFTRALPGVKQTGPIGLDSRDFETRCPPCRGDCMHGQPCPSLSNEPPPTGEDWAVGLMFAAFCVLVFFVVPLVPEFVRWLQR